MGSFPFHLNLSVLPPGPEASLDPVSSLVQLLSHVWHFVITCTAAKRLPYLSLFCGVFSNSCPLSRWWHPTISSFVVPFFSRLQDPASGSFQVSHLFASGGQSTGVSASASFPPKKSQGWSPSEWTGWISLQSKGLSRVFSNTTVPKHQFFGTQLSSQSNSNIHTWPLEKP